MYEEKKAFPVKWVILGLLVLVSIIGITSYNNYLKGKVDQDYKDVLARIKKAGEEYGQKHIDQVKELEEECVSLETLIKEGYLVSDSKKEPVIYNPKTKQKMSGKVFVVYDDERSILAQYMFDEICKVNYDEKVKLAVSSQTTHGFVATIEAPEGLKLNSFEYKVDDEKFFKHDSPTYRFDELLSGNHKLTVKATDYLDVTYERTLDVILGELVKPELVYDEVTSSVTVKCPETEDEAVVCAYTIDSETWNKVTEENSKYTFVENGQIIAMATDGFNESERVTQEVTIKPTCIDSRWSVCTGCTAPCGSTCLGTQTSNCGNTRSCTLYGTCTSSSSSVAITYLTTVKASNGNPATQSFNVPSGYNRVFTVNPTTDYEYSNVKCDVGTASYSTRTKQLTVNTISSPRTCTVYFTKKVIAPTYFTVSFMGYDGKIIETKQVLSGKTVTAITAPVIPGYNFESWTRNGVTYNFSSSVLGNLILNANYSANKIAVTFDSDGGTSRLTQYIVSGQVAYRPVDSSRTGYRFNNWYLGGSAYNFSTPVTAPITLKAIWIPLTTVRVNFDGSTTYRSVELNNFSGLHYVSGTCNNGFAHTMSGNVINITINSLEVCEIYVQYY